MRKGYKQSQANHTLFIKRGGIALTTLIVYVDNIVVTGNNSREVECLKHYLSQEFEIRPQGTHVFLGIEVIRSKREIFLSQSKYVLDLLSKAEMLGCKPCETPVDCNYKLKEDDGLVTKLLDVDRYQ